MIGLPFSSFVPLWLRVKQTVFQRGVGLGFISHKATKTQRRQEGAYPQSFAPSRLRANPNLLFDSRGDAEARSSADRFELITKTTRYAAT